MGVGMIVIIYYRRINTYECTQRHVEAHLHRYYYHAFVGYEMKILYHSIAERALEHLPSCVSVRHSFIALSIPFRLIRLSISIEIWISCSCKLMQTVWFYHNHYHFLASHPIIVYCLVHSTTITYQVVCSVAPCIRLIRISFSFFHKRIPISGA